MPDPETPDLFLPLPADLRANIFKNTDTGEPWSLNDLWLQLQEATNPFAGIQIGSRPEFKTACFSYPGNVTVETPEGPRRVGDVLLTVALALEVEQVDLTSAKKVEYLRSDGDAIQRVEFASHEPGMEDWRISLQLPKNAKDLNELRTRYDQPNCEESK